ncbi:MAG: DNA-formamidopyrimidine glycosylase family protein, partial [Patescibacteria group bacterium]
KFKKEIIGRKILKIERKGKNILIHLSSDLTLLVHQKMTGHLLYGTWYAERGTWKSKKPGPLNDPENRFIHLLFFLSNRKEVALCDMRKFAKVLIWPTDKLNELEDIRKLGPDPFDKNFTFEKFKKTIQRAHGKIKTVLMDQTFISGIGNIYSDEILWVARVHPLKRANKLKKEELQKIFKTIKPVLKKAIKAR